ncbi:MAG: DUF1275 domain-containing protein [Firmicutes bacterium]|nr:DUF1275 domain-containing protein [Bacillota bacterium]
MSESLILSLLLAFSGGFQDAYTFIERGRVFANAQTGNVVLMSASILDKDLDEMFKYLLPLLAFIAGIIIADLIEHHMKETKILHWRQMIIMAEIIIMVIVGVLPVEYDKVANCLVSLACAMQVETFRYFCGNAYASTMIIGNLRSGTHAFSRFLVSGNRPELKKAGEYFAVILVFGLGAGVGAELTPVMREETIWGSAIVLLICYLLMELDKIELLSDKAETSDEV